MVRYAILITTLLAAAPVAAQEAASGAAASGDGVSGDGIELEVGAREARAIDVDVLRAALARELAMEVRMAGRGGPRVPRVRVRAIGRTRAVLELRRPDGSRMQRSTELDHDPAERLETIVILAVNMVRDEASELLELLRRRRPTEGPAEGAAAGATGTDPQAGTSEDTVASEMATATETMGAIEAAPTESTAATAMLAASEPHTATPTSAATATSAAVEGAPESEREGPAIEATTTGTHATAGEVAPPAEALPRPPGPRVVRIGLGALVGSVPAGRGYEVTLLGGLELAWTPTDFLAFGVRDVGGGVPLSSIGRWSAGGALFAELGWILDPTFVLHLELGADVRINGAGGGQDSAGVAPLAVIGARFFPIRELSIALQTGIHVVVTDAWSSNLHVLPEGAVLWTGGVSFAVHVS